MRTRTLTKFLEGLEACEYKNDWIQELISRAAIENQETAASWELPDDIQEAAD